MQTFKFKIGNNGSTTIKDAKLHLAGTAGVLMAYPILSRGISLPDNEQEAYPDMFDNRPYEFIHILGDLEPGAEIGCIVYVKPLGIPISPMAFTAETDDGIGTVTATVKGEGTTDEPQHVFIVEGDGGEGPVEGCPFSTTMDSEFGMQFGIETSHSLDGMVFAYGGYNHGSITTDVPQDLVGMQLSFNGTALSVSLETPDLGYGDDDLKVTLDIPGLIPYTIYLRKSPEPNEYFYLGELIFDNGAETDFMAVGMCVSIIVSPAVEA